MKAVVIRLGSSRWIVLICFLLAFLPARPFLDTCVSVPILVFGRRVYQVLGQLGPIGPQSKNGYCRFKSRAKWPGGRDIMKSTNSVQPRKAATPGSW